MSQLNPKWCPCTWCCLWMTKQRESCTNKCYRFRSSTTPHQAAWAKLDTEFDSSMKMKHLQTCSLRQHKQRIGAIASVCLNTYTNPPTTPELNQANWRWIVWNVSGTNFVQYQKLLKGKCKGKCLRFPSDNLSTACLHVCYNWGGSSQP